MRPSWYQNAVQEAFENNFAQKYKKCQKCNTYATFGGSELPRQMQNPFKIDEKSMKTLSKIGVQFLMHLGDILEANLASKPSQNRCQIDQKSMKNGHENRTKYQMCFEWFFGGSWSQPGPSGHPFETPKWSPRGEGKCSCFWAWKVLGGSWGVLGPLGA